MIRDAIKLVLSGIVSTKLWIAAMLANVGTLVLVEFLDQELFPNMGAAVTATLVGVLIVGAVGIFVTLWKLTRKLGRAKADEHGDIGSWIGWGIVSALPAIPFIALLDFGAEAPPLWWFNSLLVAVTMCLAVPVAVHASGRAINAAGPSLGVIFDYWLKNYFRLFIAYFAVSAPVELVSDALNRFGRGTSQEAILGSFIVSTMYFISSILAIAITVLAYREAEAHQPSTAG